MLKTTTTAKMDMQLYHFGEGGGNMGISMDEMMDKIKQLGDNEIPQLLERLNNNYLESIDEFRSKGMADDELLFQLIQRMSHKVAMHTMITTLMVVYGIDHSIPRDMKKVLQVIEGGNNSDDKSRQ